MSRTIQQCLIEGIHCLQTHSDSARLEAELLLAHCLQKERPYLIAWSEKVVDDTPYAQFQQLLDQRAQGVPIAYLLGYRDFWTLRLKVNNDTLIPRPETERLVEAALELIQQSGKKSPACLDLGTGSGAIALAIASEYPQATMIATDIDAASLALAQDNALENHLHHVDFMLSDWFAALPLERFAEQFDMILSNPPYIAENDPHCEQGDVRFEPRRALVSGRDGLDAIHHLIQQSWDYLSPQGWLLLEHGYDQGEQVVELLTLRGFQNCQCLLDLAGQPRVSLGQK
ncbi:MAG TPA: peptide chain release factor N(5)-glutamine methyltransferase [Thiothrix sp.]|nr:peptide chain release factor N(5)-glutamine methyltransferase [Thiothrix sp.]